MKKTTPLVLLLAACGTLSSIGATKIGGALKVMSPRTGAEVSTVRVGKSLDVRITAKEFHLLANRNVKFTYALSILPDGSNTPISFSGTIASKFTLLEQGGATKTKQEMASWAGTQVARGLITIPDTMPTGQATLSVSISGKDVGSVTYSKNLTIKL
jgi:hypothetical protein